LTLKQPPCGQTRFDESLVDWHHTTAWAWGGYYARIFVNLAGREPHGQVPAAEREAFLDRLGQELTAISGPDGGPMNNRILRPKNLAPDGKPRGDPPDLMLYAGDLAYRAVGSVGNAGHFVFENDTGPDDANHAKHGIFIYHGPAADRSLPPTTKTGTPAKPQLRLVDVGPSVLQLLGVAVPNDTVGQPMDFIDAFVSQK
jgi:predicted AlkP superfamily phosphohydrolase/phosphomutase